MKRWTALGTSVVLVMVPFTGWADCAPPAFSEQMPELTATPPPPPDLSLRPKLPACLNVASPNQESCSEDDIAAYSAAVDAWETALTEFVAAANAFANQAVTDANAAVRYAQSAGPFADQAVAFANCEADEINRRAEGSE